MLEWNHLIFNHKPQFFHNFPRFFRTKQRKAYVVPACLSTKKETMYVTFAAQGHIGHIAQENEKDLEVQSFVNVTCLPLFSILMALDNPVIDYFR